MTCQFPLLRRRPQFRQYRQPDYRSVPTLRARIGTESIKTRAAFEGVLACCLNEATWPKPKSKRLWFWQHGGFRWIPYVQRLRWVVMPAAHPRYERALVSQRWGLQPATIAFQPMLEHVFGTLDETTTTADPGTAGTSLAVTTRTPFPQSGKFYILVQNSETDKTNREIMRVTGGQGTGAGSFTVVRGLEGTSGVAHAIGSYVALVLVESSLRLSFQRGYVPDYVFYATAALAAAGSDGVTAGNAAITACNADGGGEVILPGWMRVSTNLTGLANVSVVGTGPTTSGIVGDDVTNSGVGILSFEGSVAATLSLSANAAFKDRLVTITTSGLAAGDWILLRDSSQFGSSPPGTNTEFIVRVAKVTAGTPDTIYLEERIPSPIGYQTVSTAQALKLNMMAGVSIRNLGLTVPTIGSAVNRSCAIDLKYTLNAVVKDCLVSGFIGKSAASGGAPPVYGSRCRNLTVKDNSFDRCADNLNAIAPDNHNCRTVNIDGSTQAGIIDNEFTRCGGSGAMSIQQNAHTLMKGNRISGHMLDFDNSDAGSINEDQGGRGIKVLYGNAYWTIIGNHIRDCAYDGIRVDDSQFGAITGNTIFNAFNHGINITSSDTAAPWESTRNISITGNEVHTGGLAGTHGIAVFKSSKVTVTGNSVRDFPTSGSSGGIQIMNATDVTITGNVVDTVQYGIFLNTNAGRCLVVGNQVTNTTTKSIETTNGLGTSKIGQNSVGQAMNLHAGDWNLPSGFAKRVTTDVTLAGVGVQSVTGLSFFMGASEVWRFDCTLFIHNAAANTGGVKVAVSIPAGATIKALAEGTAATATTTTNAAITASATLTIAFMTFTSTATGAWVRIVGTVVNSTTAGTVQIQAAEGTNADVNTVEANSHLTAVQIG